jgi:hypothetical protein
MKQIKIAFSGKARSGKDTAGNFVSSVNTFCIIKFAEPLMTFRDNFALQADIPLLKYPDIMQAMADACRQHNSDYFVNMFENNVKNLPNTVSIINTDLRFPNEAKALRRLGFKIVRIERANRPNSGRDDNHESEIALDNYTDWDAVIENNGTLKEFKAKVLGLLGDK